MTQRRAILGLCTALMLLVGACAPARSGVLTVHAGQPITRTSLFELAAASDAVIIGTVQAEAGTRNMAREPGNPLRESTAVTILGQDYEVDVEEWLAGSGEPRVVVTFARSHTLPGLPAPDDAEFIPLTIGARYVMFLKDQMDGTADFVPAPEPWRFRLTNVSEPETFWDGAHRHFRPQSALTFIQAVRAAVP